MDYMLQQKYKYQLRLLVRIWILQVHIPNLKTYQLFLVQIMNGTQFKKRSREEG